MNEEMDRYDENIAIILSLTNQMVFQSEEIMEWASINLFRIAYLLPIRLLASQTKFNFCLLDQLKTGPPLGDLLSAPIYWLHELDMKFHY